MIREEYFGDLNVVYTFGPQFGRRVVTHADLEQMAMPPQALRRSALEHLEVLASRAEFHGQPPALMLSFEGLESSLLLATDFWQRLEGAVAGELVVGVPARDVVVVTGSNSTAGLEKARRCVERVFFAGDEHLLSRTLLVRRGNAWEPFDRPAGVPRQTRGGFGPARHRGPDQPPRQYQEHVSWPGERVPVARPMVRPMHGPGAPMHGPGAPMGMPPRPAANPMPAHTGSMPPVSHTGMIAPVGHSPMAQVPPLTHTGSMAPIHTGSMSPIHTGTMSPIHTGPMPAVPASSAPDVAPYSAIPYSAIPYSAIPNSASPHVPAPHAASEYLQSRGAQPKYRDDAYAPADYPVSSVPQAHSPRRDDRDGFDGYGADGYRSDEYRADEYRPDGYRSGDYRAESSYRDAGYRPDEYQQDDYVGSQPGYGAEPPAYPNSWGTAPSAPSRPEFRSGPRARFAR